MSSFASPSFQCSALFSASRLKDSFSALWRVIWLIAGMSFGLRAIVADQIYSNEWRQPITSPDRLELASRVFPYERAILNARAYAYLHANVASEEAIGAIREGQRRDPAAADLLVAEMQYSYMLGKNKDVITTFARLQKLAPRSWFVQDVKEKGEGYDGVR